MCSISSFAQTPEDIKKEADKLFDDGAYLLAYDEYNKVSGQYGREHDWNFKYGACALYAENDKSNAINRLSYAVQNPSIDKRAYYFMGRAYHLNYQFKEAEKYYNKFKDQASSGQLKDFDVDAQLNGCRFGRKLLSNVTDLIVMEKREIAQESFYDLYNMSEIGGSILVTDKFGTKYDLKIGHRSVIHFPKNSPNVFYSSYGEDGSTGLDIYQKKKLPDGTFSLPQKVKGQVNSNKDDAYAYMHPNGRYLYFCSKGHNSMGGYDVFRSEYDPNKDEFGPPENLDFAISSPDDDIMYVVDAEDKIAYFASRRESTDGKLYVYNVRVERIKMQMAAIKGQFENKIVSGNREVNIVIEDFNNGSEIGSFNSKASNGDYFVTFPKGGKYKYFVTVKGSDVTHYAIVEVPLLQELRPLKQKITLLRDDAGEEYVKIENLFDEEFDDPITVMAEIYQELSKLNPNADNFDLDSLNAMKASSDVLVDNGLNQFDTKKEVAKTIERKLEDLNKDKISDEDNANIAFNLANEKSDLANEKMLDLNKKIQEAENTADPNAKKQLFNEAAELKNEIEELNGEVQNLVGLGTELNKSALAKQQIIKEGQQALNEVNDLPDGEIDQLANTVKNNSNFFKENIKPKDHKPDLIEQIVRAGNEKTKQVNKVGGALIALQNEQTQLKKDKQILEDRLENTKKKKDREIIENGILEKESELDLVNDQLKDKQKKYEELVSGKNDGIEKYIGVAKKVDDDQYDNSEYTNALTDAEKDAIKSKVEGNDLTDDLAVIDKILDENGAGSRVEIFASNEQRDQYTLEQWTDEIDKEIKNLRDDLNTATPERKERILEEIKAFEELKEQKAKDYEVVEANPDEIVAEVSTNEILPDYNEQKEALDAISDPVEKANQSLKLNRELKEEIVEEKRQLEQLADQYPDNENIKARISNLQEIEDDIDQKIKDDSAIVNGAEGIKEPAEIASSFDEDYQDKVNEIFEIENEDERNIAIKDLNNEILEAANERIQELDALLENNPNNADAKAEKEELQVFKENLENNLNQPLVEPVLIDVNDISTKVEEDQLVPDYQSKLNEISEVEDEFDRKKSENELNEELLSKVRGEIKTLERLANDNPGNKDLQKRITNLKKLDDKTNQSIIDNEDWMKNNPKITTTDQLADANEVNPNYQNRLSEINELEDEEVKRSAVKELNEETLNAIETKINILDQELKDNPNASNFNELTEEKQKLQNLKIEISENMDQPAVKMDEVADVNPNPSVDEVLPSYQASMSAIEASTADELSKEKQKLDLNKSLISKIDQELSRLNQLKNDQPEWTADINQRMDALKVMKELKEADLKTSEERIVALSGTASNGSSTEINENIEIEDVFPTYQDELSTIENADLSELEKARNQQNVRKSLVTKIDQEINRLNDLRNSNPDQENKIDRTIERLENFKSDLNAEISTTDQRIESLSDGTNDTSEITIEEDVEVEDLFPTYKEEFAAIDNSSATELNSEKSKQNLRKSLLSTIEREINQLKGINDANPELQEKMDKRMDKLEQLRAEVTDEIAAGDQRIQSLSETATNSIIDPANISEIATVDQVFPNYSDELENINLAQWDEQKKAEEKINLNRNLIGKIDREIDQLNQLKNDQPELSAKIDARITGLDNMKAQKEREIQQSESVIESISGTRPQITISSLIPNYEAEMEEISGSNSITEKDRLEGENQLNNELISKIDQKIEELQEEVEDGSDQVDQIYEEIDLLEELKAAKRQEIESNNEVLRKMGGVSDTATTTKSLEEINPEDYNASSAKQIVADNENNLNEINELKIEIDELENQLENTTDEKESAKINTQIDKRKLKLAKVENEVLEDLASANRDEYQNEVKDTEIDGVIATSTSTDDPDVIDANRKLKEAQVLMNEASQLRDQADATKNPIEKNTLLNQANNKEREANQKTEAANRIFKTARVVNNYNSDQVDVIVEVEENPEDRKSAKMLKEADQLNVLANGLSDRVDFLRDSANTVKKKFREAILVEAQQKDDEAAEMRTEANKLREKAENIRSQEDEILTVQIDKSTSNPDPETTQDVASTKDYKDFVEAKKSAENNLQKAKEIEEQIQTVKNSQKRKIKAAVVTYQDGGSVESSIAEDEEVKKDQEKIDALRKEQEEYRDRALKDLADANNILDKNADIKENMIALADKNVAPREEVKIQDSLSADFEAPQTLTTDIFRTTEDAIYSEQKKIPMDQKTSGLVYKVQVGAFRKPLPQDQFKEFAPVSGQRLNNGITRYMAGYFTKENAANGARQQIRGVGYGDAFVVAYCNGERITIAEARQIERGEIECEGSVENEDFVTNQSSDNNNASNNNNGSNNNTADNNVNSNNNNNSDNTTSNTNNANSNAVDNNGGADVRPNNETEEQIVSYYTNYPDAAKATQVEIVKGLFYTVQIGVYRRPVKSDVLFNIQPLNSQRMDNGNIRYSTGKYENVQAATSRKNSVVTTGISDAFVTAYFDGERITIAEANRMLQESGSAVLYNSTENQAANFSGNSDAVNSSTNKTNDDTSTSDNTNNNTNNNNDNNNTNTTNNTSNNDKPEVDDENVNTSESGDANANSSKGLLSDQTNGDTGPPYRLNLGYFEDGVPVSFTDKLLDNQDAGILSISDLEDNVLYFVGTFDTREEAEEQAAFFQTKGFNNPEIVSLKLDEVEDEVTYYPEGVYYKIQMGRYMDEIPGEYANILLQTEGILETETDIEGATYLTSTKINTFEEVLNKLLDYGDLGFEDMKIVSYYQYDAIPLTQAEKIMKGEKIGKLQIYEVPTGVNADPYLYNKNAIYFRVNVGRFYEVVPGDFTELLFNSEEENILREETVDQEVIFHTENTYSYDEAKALKDRLITKGFTEAAVAAYHKYDSISLQKALNILEIEE